jgi:phospholipid-binding lipoprotein MlaA
MRSTTRLSLLALCLFILCGCATLPPGSKRDPRDPWERMNRASYKFNDVLDKAVLRPVARGYTKTPQAVQRSVHNFMDNIEYPVTIVNDLLQGQIKPFFSDIARLLLNTSIGIGGLFDPASSAGLDKNNRDFGQTLGKWGVGSGPYLVVPIFGPYTVRDGIGASTVDTFAKPLTYARLSVSASAYALRQVDHRSRLLPLDATLDSAYDPYAFIRNAYLQQRQFMIGGSGSKSEEETEQKLLEEAGEEEPPPQGTKPQPPGKQPPAPPPEGAAPQPPGTAPADQPPPSPNL